MASAKKDAEKKPKSTGGTKTSPKKAAASKAKTSATSKVKTSAATHGRPTKKAAAKTSASTAKKSVSKQSPLAKKTTKASTSKAAAPKKPAAAKKAPAKRSRPLKKTTARKTITIKKPVAPKKTTAKAAPEAEVLKELSPETTEAAATEEIMAPAPETATKIETAAASAASLPEPGVEDEIEEAAPAEASPETDRLAAEETAANGERSPEAEEDGAVAVSAETEEPAPETSDEKAAADETNMATAEATAPERTEPKETIFALDIGTRSVIGIVAEKTADGGLSIIATRRQEHKTRAMLDGQIHDVPKVAAVIGEVKGALEEIVGPLESVAVAAAGRALYTMTADAEMHFPDIITTDEERRLDFTGVQAAQAKLASSSEVDDPSRYYCVGYSTIQYTLDGSRLKTLVGQRGHTAKATVIATFLPRQVIDSMDAALDTAKLGLQAITLEPIAAINVLIPPTMRHLNLVLVDIGAGTSDVAITKNGSVVAYGMVPQAGDEITEAISDHFLLDFNVAERIKREAAEGKDVSFENILGMPIEKTANEVIEPVLPAIQNLAEAIAKQVLDLNGTEPQAVLLVGGGALTPRLAGLIAKHLGLPEARVAVRRPGAVEGIEELPAELMLPDAVTPLGILKIASLNTLHFLTVFVDDREYRLFNFQGLAVSDALLAAGVSLKRFNGEPGGVLRITVNGEAKSFEGAPGTRATLTLDGEPADLGTPIDGGAHIAIIPGEPGEVPRLTIADVIDEAEPYTIYINGNQKKLAPELLVNGKKPDEGQLLADGDVVTSRDTRSLGEALKAAGYPPTGKKLHYKLNGTETQFNCIPEILLNDAPASLSMTIYEGDRVEYLLPENPKLGEVLGLSESDTTLIIYFNGAEKKIPSSSVSLELNGRPASANTLVTEGCSVRYERSERRTTLVNTALLAVGFEPPSASSGMLFDIKVNDQKAQFNDPIKNGDRLDINIHLAEGVAAKRASVPASAPKPEAASEASSASTEPAASTDGAASPTPPPTPAVDKDGRKDGLLADYLAQLEKEKTEKKPEEKSGDVAEEKPEERHAERLRKFSATRAWGKK